jgi:branched-chain amino acid transport system substrate-binding protein
MRRDRPYGVVLVLLSVLLLAAPGSAPAQAPIRIGASVSITGRDAVQGGYVREGYLLCQKHTNEKGGVLGRPLQFLITDDGSDGRSPSASMRS